MKNGSFLALLYREWLLSRKNVATSFIMVAAGFLILGLIALSFKVGNMALLSTEVMDLLITEGKVFLKILPVMLMSSFAMIPSSTALLDVNPAWERFRKSTPQSCYRLALAKSVTFSTFLALSIAFSFLSTVLICFALGDELSQQEVAFALALILLFSFAGAFMQVAVTFFKSIDKAGIAMVALFMPLVVIPIAILSKKTPDGASGNLFNILSDFFVKTLPVIAFLLIAVVALQFILLALLYKRREK